MPRGEHRCRNIFKAIQYLPSCFEFAMSICPSEIFCTQIKKVKFQFAVPTIKYHAWHFDGIRMTAVSSNDGVCMKGSSHSIWDGRWGREGSDSFRGILGGAARQQQVSCLFIANKHDYYSYFRSLSTCWAHFIIFDITSIFSSKHTSFSKIMVFSTVFIWK